MNLLDQFKSYLFSQDKRASSVTVKNYLSDLNHFFGWFEKTYSKAFEPKEISRQVIDAYKLNLSAAFSTSSLERHLSTLRKFFKFLSAEGLIALDPFQPLIANEEHAEIDPWHIKDFKNSLYENSASRLTIKNYLIDIKQFLSWSQSELGLNANAGGFNLDFIDPKFVEEYKHKLLTQENFSPATVNRKLSSLRKYLSWAQSEGLIDDLGLKVKNAEIEKQAKIYIPEAKQELPNANYEPSVFIYSAFPPLRLAQKISKGITIAVDGLAIIPLAKVVEKAEYALWKVKGQPVFTRAKSIRLPKSLNSANILGLRNLPKASYAPSEISTKYFPWHKKAWFNLRYNRPKWYKTYHSYPVTHYFHFAVLIIFLMAISFGFYNAFFQKGNQSPLLAAAPTAPPRILSFQGRLTDNSDNPITANTPLRFAIYDSLSASGGGDLLWQEIDSVNPDTDGIFNTLLGSNTPIPPDVFTQHSALWLGVTVGSTPELAPRQPLATVAFATNAEALQGMFPTTQAGLTSYTNTVLALDGTAGSPTLTIGSAGVPTSTIFQSIGGSFKLSGQAVILTTNAGTNSNIVVAPDGLGKIDLQKPLQNSSNNNNISTATGAVEVDDLLAVLATSSGQSALTINQNSTGPLISASTSGVAKFTVDSSGNLTAAGNGALGGSLTVSGTNTTINNIAYIWPGSTTVGNVLSYTAGGNLQWVAQSGGGSSFWQELSGGLSPVTSGDDLLLGGSSTTSAAFAFTGLMNNTASGNHQTQASMSGNLIVMPNYGFGGNVGIGTTAPGGSLDVRGQGIISATQSTLNPNYDTLLVGQRPAADSYGSVRISPQNSAFRGYKLEVYDNNTVANYFDIYDVTNSADRLHINSSGNIGIGTTTPLGTLDVRGNSGITPVASFSGQTAFATMVVDNSSALGDIFTASTSGLTRLRIDNNGDLLPGVKNAQDIGSSTMQWRNIYGQNFYQNGTLLANYWQRNLGAISPINITDDLLIGGASTASALFSFTGISTGQTQASISGNLVVMPNNGYGGRVGIGIINPGAALDVNGDVALEAQTGGIRQIVFNNVGGGSYPSVGGAARIAGQYGDFYWQAAGGDAMQLGAWHEVILQGGRASSSSLPFISGSGTAYNTRVVNTSNSIGLTVEGISAQTANLQQWIVNSSILDVISASGNVGIGTTNPLVALDVRGNSGTLAAASVSAKTSFAGMVIDNSGLGDILTASSSGANRFSINNGGQLLAPFYSTCTLKTNGSGLISCGTDLTGGSSFWQELIGALSPIQSGDDLLLGSPTGATTSAAFAFTGLMNNVTGGNHQTQASFSGNLIVMPNNGFGGNVGIGTTNPGYPLDVNGDVNVGGNDIYLGGNRRISDSVSSSYTDIIPQNDTLIVYNPSNTNNKDFKVYSDGTHYADLGQSGTTTAAYAYLNSSTNNLVLQSSAGNVGIGTITPYSTLSVAGSMRVVGGRTYLVDNELFALGIGRTSVNSNFYLGTNTNTNPDLIFSNNGGTAVVTFTDGGNVGIGTTNPLVALDVRGNSGTLAVASVSGKTSFAALVTNNDGTGDLFTASASGWTRFIVSNGGAIGLSGGYGSNGQCLTSGGSAGVAASWGACGSGGASYWNLVSGIGVANGGYITPINSTADLLIGGQSTASAVFAVLNLASGTPTATVGGNFIVMPYTSGANELGGSVGIGTTTPQALLNISSASDAAIFLQANTGQANKDNNAYIKLNQMSGAATIGSIIGLVGNAGRSPENFNSYGGTLSNALLLGTTANALQLGTNNTVGLTVDGNQNVGIGLNNPAYVLDVSLTKNAANGLNILNSNGGISSTAVVNLTADSSYNGSLFQASSVYTGITGAAGMLVLNTGATTNGLLLRTSASAKPIIFSNLTEAMRLTGGSLGIGTTIPLATLDVRGNSGTTPIASFSANTAFVGMVVDNSGLGDIFAASASGLNRFVIQNNGNVGIGTTAPAVALDVVGSASFSATLTVSTIRPPTGALNLQYKSGPNAWSNALTILDNNGNVGIGTTTPDQALSVFDGHIYLNETGQLSAKYDSQGAAIINSLSGLAFNGAAASRPELAWYRGSRTYPEFAIRENASADTGGTFWAGNGTGAPTAVMSIYNTGNVGIGVTSPYSVLTIASRADDLAANSAIKIQASDFTTNGGFLYINKNSGSGTYASIQAGDSLAWRPLALNQSGGNVGIGTTTPLALLDVNGAASVSGALFFNQTAPNTPANIITLNGQDLNFSTSVGGANGLVKMKLANNGQFFASNLIDFEDNTYFLDLNEQSSGTFGMKTHGAIYIGDDSAVTPLSIQTTGGIIVGTGGTGKLTATTLDPLYTIDGTRYSTYAPSIIGVKEEVTGKATLAYNTNRQAYTYTLDLNNQTVGSDVWLFSRVTDPDVNLTDILLTPDSSAKVWYKKNTATRSITFYADQPTDLTFRLTGARMDHDHWGNLSEEINPTITGLFAPAAQAVSTDNGDNISTPSSEFTIIEFSDQNNNTQYALSDSLNNIVKIAQSYSDLLVANIQAGLVSAQKITTNSLAVATENITINGQNIRDYIASIVQSVLDGTNNNVISPIASIDELHTNFISPVGNNAQIGLKLDNNKLSVLNGNTASASAVAVIDNQGNASFSGQLTSNSLNTNDATISGTLHAGKILADDIVGLHIQAATVSAQYITNITNVYGASDSGTLNASGSGAASNATASGSSNFGLIANSASQNNNSLGFNAGNYIDIASFSGQFAYVENLSASTATFGQGLTVFGPTSLSDTSVVGQLSINGSFILANNSINVLGSDLNLQPLQQGGISLMGGLVYFDTHGNLKVGGNAEFAKDVTVKGNLAAGVLSPLPGNDLNVNLGENNSSLTVHGASNSAVLSINTVGDLIASGAATISKLNLSLVQPVLAVSLNEVIATGSAGTASITPFQTQVTIDNAYVTDKSLIYITPTSSTNNQVLYLLRQVPNADQTTGSFTVGLQNPSIAPIPFNWMIVN